MAKKIDIAGTLNAATTDGVLGFSEQIKDESKGKMQSSLNKEFGEGIERIERKSDIAYNAVKTLEGLSNANEAMQTLAGQVVQIEENKQNIASNKADADAKLTELGSKAQPIYLTLSGKFCFNTNTGEIRNAQGGYDSYIIPIQQDFNYSIEGLPTNNYGYSSASAQCYSGYPSTETNLGYKAFINGKIDLIEGTKFVVVTLNNLSSLPNCVELIKENLKLSKVVENIDVLHKNAGIYIAKDLTLKQGVALNERTISKSILKVGDKIEVTAIGDALLRYNIIDTQGHVLGATRYPNIRYVLTVTEEFLTSSSDSPFGFYANSSEVVSDGDVKIRMRIYEDDRICIPSRINEIENSLNERILFDNSRIVGELINSNVVKLTKLDYSGVYCFNVNTGVLYQSTQTSNSYIIQVEELTQYKIISSELLYGNNNSVQCYSDYPSEQNSIGSRLVNSENYVLTPLGCKYIAISINPSLNGETTIVKSNTDHIPTDLYIKEYDNLGVGFIDRRVIKNNLKNGDVIKVRVDDPNNTLTDYRLLSQTGQIIEQGVASYEPNKTYIIKFDRANEFTAPTFGVYIRETELTGNKGKIKILIKIIHNNEGFTADEEVLLLKDELKNIQRQADVNSDTLSELADIPNNNNYIKKWDLGNKLVTRLYVENKELALADGLFIRQFFRALNGPKNNGFNFGTKTKDWAITIAPSKGDFDVYETTSYDAEGVRNKYGKIAIKIADWDAIEWPSSNVISIPVQTESNLEDIVFDWNEFTKPLNATSKVADESVTEKMLAPQLKEKIDRGSSLSLDGYELFSLGDSLSAGGIWQTRVAELAGCVFDQAKNNKAGAMLSVGGTNSFGPTFDNVLWRAKNLIDQGYIQSQGENAIVVLENVNDSYNAFDDSVRTIVPTTPIEGYSESEFTSNLLNSLIDKYNVNAVFRLTKTLAGKNLKITSLPTKEGDVTLRVGWAGPGYSNYNVHVIPQASDDLTMKYVLDKILEYAYTGITDALGEDGISVDFSSGNANYMPTVEFTDTDNTGMTCVVTDNPNAKTSIAKYFIGDSIDDWTNLSKWQTGITYSQGWKSTIELLMRTYPKLNLFVSLFPMHSVTASEYLLPNGTYDTAAYNKVSRMENMRKMQVELGNIAKFYSLPFLDVFAECGIGISNMLTYYNASANVHPKNEGYYKFGETIASQLKRYIV